MDIDALTDADRKALAKDLAAELDTGLYGNRAVLSRRQLLSLAGGSAGVAGLVALGVDPATAQSAAGQVGTQSSPEDVFAFNLDVQGGAEFNGTELTGVGSLSTEILGSDRHYAGAYPGSDPDARLDATISAASVGDKIYLEAGTYQSDRTISNTFDIEGVVSSFANSTFLNSCVWTFDVPVSVSKIGAGGSDNVEFNANGNGCSFTNINQNTLTINFATGTSGGIADSIYSDIGSSAIVNDPDGNNLIGDVY